MPQKINIGDRVEVNIIWAAGGSGEPPLRHWFGGYRVHSVGKKTIMVKIERGVFAGCLVSYSKRDVKHDS